MKTATHIFAVLILGTKHPQYFEADNWVVSDGVLRLAMDEMVVAMFSVRNIIGLIDLTAGAHLSEAAVNERLKQPGLGKHPVINLDLLRSEDPGIPR